MGNNIKTVSVAYTKLQNGHGFQAADKQAEWLLVTSTDLDEAIEEVSEQLEKILGGVWRISDESKKSLQKGTVKKDNNLVVTPFSGFVGVMSWTSDVA